MSRPWYRFGSWILGVGALLSGAACPGRPSTRPEADPVVETPVVETTAVETTDEGSPARILGTLPKFSLSDQQGESFGSEDLLGHVWIATFIFTRCAATCPAQTAQFGRLQRELKDHEPWNGVRLVSISVDPEHDTPDVLRTYAKAAGADAKHWRFLTGTRDAIWKLSKQGFKLPVSGSMNNRGQPIVHSQRFILVDQTARIRGYYDGLLDTHIAKLKRHLDEVLSEKD